jgi:CDP-diacylglycerol--glycerol-3-phosphate 3-phosphatidyltransferase
LGPVALAAARAGWPRLLFVPILLTGLLSDIYDGVLARRFGVSTPGLRRYDSTTDVLYYGFILGATWILCRQALSAHWGLIAALLVSEAACTALSLARFRVLPATHSYLAKFYGLCLFAASLALLAFEAPGWAVVALAAVGLLANAEIFAILLLWKRAPVDVPSIFFSRPEAVVSKGR